MKPCRILAVLAVALPLAAAAADTPSTHLKKGEWSYRATSTMTSGPMAGHSFTHQWKRCISHDGAPPSLMPPQANGQVHCSPPRLTHDARSYRTTMSCTTTAHGMTSRMDEDVTFTPSADGTHVQIHGTMHQTMSGAPVKMAPMEMTLEVEGRRTGPCGGS